MSYLYNLSTQDDEPCTCRRIFSSEKPDMYTEYERNLRRTVIHVKIDREIE